MKNEASIKSLSALDTFVICWQVFSDKFEGLVTKINRLRKEQYHDSRDNELSEHAKEHLSTFLHGKPYIRNVCIR